LKSKFLTNNYIDFFIESSQGDIHGTGLFAETTINTAPCHMHSPDQVKQRKGRGIQLAWDHIMVLKGTLLTKTHRTDVSTTKALDTSREKRLPKMKPLLMGPGVKFLHCYALHTASLRAVNRIRRKGTLAFTCIGQFLWTGKAYRNDLPWIKLIPLKKGLQSSLIATTDQDTKYGLWVTPAQGQHNSIERVSAVSRSLQITKRHILQLFNLGKQKRTDMAFPSLETKESMNC
jgi:hypothetical protein